MASIYYLPPTPFANFGGRQRFFSLLTTSLAEKSKRLLDSESIVDE